MQMEKLNFLDKLGVEKIAKDFGTPIYVYSEKILKEQAAKVLAFPNAFGLTARYAMKASSNAAILKLFDSLGLHMDASSAYEAKRAMLAGVAAKNISLSSQQMPENIAELNSLGVKFNACSLYQLEEFGKALQGGSVGVRINPGLGSGGTKRTNVGGPASSFGIWFEDFPKIFDIAKKYGLKIVRIHTHIGSGSDPEVWQKVAKMSLESVRQFKDVHTLNMGGGFKVGRMDDEKSTDLQLIGKPVAQLVADFAKETGRKLHFEIEPGTFLLANCGSLISTIQDTSSTGAEGYKFLKLDCGMNDILRPAIYGAQHPLVVVQKNPTEESEDYVIVGHCCESGDILTPTPNDPEGLAPRKTAKAKRGDLCVIEGAGAYCHAMSAKNYNSYPEAPELMFAENGELKLIRKRQTLEQIIQNEIF